MKTARRACVWCLALGLGVAGCETGSRYGTVPSESRVDIDLEPSTTRLVTGETVTITARVNDTYGRDAKVAWMSTAGDIDTEQDGRVARIKFNEPGTYTVSAVLIIDGNEVRRDFVEIHVKPLT